MKVKIITSDWCGYCTAAKKLLDEKGMEYEEVDVSESLDIMSSYNLRTVPQIFLDDKFLPGGYAGLKEYFNGN